MIKTVVPYMTTIFFTQHLDFVLSNVITIKFIFHCGYTQYYKYLSKRNEKYLNSKPLF